MSDFSSDVLKRHGVDEMSRNAFYFVIVAILTWGFVLTSIIAKLTSTWNPGIIMFLLVGLGIPILGIILSSSSDNAFVSFIGFNLVVGGLSAIIGPVLAMYEIKAPGLVERAATMTAFVTAVMGLSGLVFPNFYRSIGGALFGALSALLIVSIIQLFVPALRNVGVIDYIAAGIFALYVGYDMHRASEMTATLDNAVDIAVSFYLDIINLFIRLLKILKPSDD